MLGASREGDGERRRWGWRGHTVRGSFRPPREASCSRPAHFSLFFLFLFPLTSRSDKTLQDIVYKLVPGLFKGTAMGGCHGVALGLFVTRSHPPGKLVPHILCCPP